MARKSHPKRAGFKKSGPRLRKGPLRSAIKNVVKSVLNKKSETKMVSWFGGSNFPSTTAYPGNGQAQNGQILSNTTDIHALLPQLDQGVDDWRRIGTKVSPVSLKFNFYITINGAYLNSNNPVARNLVAVLYVLEHKILKDYVSLGLNNDFTQLLDPGNGSTVAFRGSTTDANLPIAKQFYKLCKKKIIPLRSDGQWIAGSGGSAGQMANQNSAPNSRHFSFDLVKYLPKTLTYPETTSGTTPPTTLWPTNCSLFWAIGFYYTDLTTFTTGTPPSDIQCMYNTQLAFKDL